MKISREIMKGIVIGVLVTSLVFCSIYAAPVKKTIEVVFSDMKIAVDGKLLELKDAQGNSLQPILYGGTTYLPVRAIAQALGKEVTPPKEDNTLYIGKIVKPGGRIMGISELAPFTQSKAKTGVVWDIGKKLKIAGIEYEALDSITCSGIGAGGSGNVDYGLNSEYSKLTGVFGVDDSSPDPVNKKMNEAGAILQVYGDNNLLYETILATKGANPHKIDVDLKGVKLLSIRIKDFNKASDYRYRYNFVNVKITKNLQ